MLFQVSPNDPATYGAVALVLTVVALAASYIPARRATRVDRLWRCGTNSRSVSLFRQGVGPFCGCLGQPAQNFRIGGS